MKGIAVLGLFLGLALTQTTLFAQTDVNQKVNVIKPYEPVINDAFKISELPKIVDTNRVISKFDYELPDVRYSTTFQPTPIKSARLVSEPLSKLYTGQVKAGIGSYITPMAQIYLGSKRNEQWNWNVLVDHLSSHGKVKNEADEKVYAGYGNSKGAAQASYFTKNNTVFSVNTQASNSKNYYYGYNPAVINDATNPAPLLKDSIENQSINQIALAANYRTNYLDSSRMNYNFDLKWRTLTGKDNLMENVTQLGANLDYFFENEFVGADLFLKFYNNQFAQSGVDSTNGSVVGFSPWLGAFGNKWRIVAGVSTVFDQIAGKYYFYPRLSMHYNIIDYFLIPYFELDGNYNENSYKSVFETNAYIRQNLWVKPTNTQLNLTFGFRGNISSRVAFNAKVNYAQIKDQYFFVNDTALPLQNKFDVVYDDINRFRILGEISYKTGESLFLAFKANYYQYTLSNESEAWHMPTYNVSLNARYFIQKKILLDANIYAIGKRNVREFDSAGTQYSKSLPGVIDLNLGVDYYISNVMSAFVNFNNIGAVMYYNWNHYPTQRFNVMVGGAFSF